MHQVRDQISQIIIKWADKYPWARDKFWTPKINPETKIIKNYRKKQCSNTMPKSTFKLVRKGGCGVVGSKANRDRWSTEQEDVDRRFEEHKDWVACKIPEEREEVE